MLSLYWHATDDQRAGYGIQALSHWIARHGGQVVPSPGQANAVGVSFSGPRMVPTLARGAWLARRYGIPLVAGGHGCYAPRPVSAFADYTVTGEAWELLRQASGVADWRAVVEASAQVTCKGASGTPVPDHRIPWAELPAVRVGERQWYAMAGVGCHRRCRFCWTSWSQPHQQGPPEVVTRIAADVRQLTPRAKVAWISNDMGRGAEFGSATMADWLAEDGRRWPPLVRIGVEGLTEARRAWFGKPIADADICEAIAVAARRRCQLVLYWIVGFEDDPPAHEALRATLGQYARDMARCPRVWFKATTFTPMPGTPLADYDLRCLREEDWQRAGDALVAMSGRFRTRAHGPLAPALWDAVWYRLDAQQAIEWAKTSGTIERGRMPASDVLQAAVRVAGKGVMGKGAPPIGSFGTDRHPPPINRTALGDNL